LRPIYERIIIHGPGTFSITPSCSVALRTTDTRRSLAVSTRDIWSVVNGCLCWRRSDGCLCRRCSDWCLCWSWSGILFMNAFTSHCPGTLSITPSCSVALTTLGTRRRLMVSTRDHTSGLIRRSLAWIAARIADICFRWAVAR
jgi:hypothetical protein